MGITESLRLLEGLEAADVGVLVDSDFVVRLGRSRVPGVAAPRVDTPLEDCFVPADPALWHRIHVALATTGPSTMPATLVVDGIPVHGELRLDRFSEDGEDLHLLALCGVQPVLGPVATVGPLPPARTVVVVEVPVGHADAVGRLRRALAVHRAVADLRSDDGTFLHVALGPARPTALAEVLDVLRADPCGPALRIGVASGDEDRPASLHDAVAALPADRGAGVGVSPGRSGFGAEGAVLRDFLAAIRDNRLEVVVQPIVDLATGAWDGGEILMRWRDHLGALCRPPTEAVLALGDEALQRRLDEAVAVRAVGLAVAVARVRDDVALHLNVFPSSIHDGHLVRLLGDQLAALGLPTSSLHLEVLEFVGYEPRHLEVLASATRRGFGLSLDDAGTGFGRFDLLEQLPFRSIKVDRVLVAALPGARARRIVAGLVDLAESLDATVIAEGVETTAEVEALRELGVGLGQGHRLSAPLPVHAFLAGLVATSDAAASGPERVATSG